MDDLSRQVTRGGGPLLGTGLRSLAAATLLAGLLLTGAGCATTAEYFGGKIEDKPPLGEVCTVEATWENHVYLASDPTHNGSPSPTIVGHLYLFGKDQGTPVKSDGNLVVKLFNDAAPPGTGHIEEWRIDKATLDRLQKKDWIGWGYILPLPWGSYRPDLVHVHMTVCYERPKQAPMFHTGPDVTMIPPSEGDMKYAHTVKTGQPYNTNAAALSAANRPYPAGVVPTAATQPAGGVMQAGGYPNAVPGQMPQAGLQGPAQGMAPGSQQAAPAGGASGAVSFPVSMPLGANAPAAPPGNFNNVTAPPQQGFTPSNILVVPHLGGPSEAGAGQPAGYSNGGYAPPQQGQPYQGQNLAPQQGQPYQGQNLAPQAGQFNQGQNVAPPTGQFNQAPGTLPQGMQQFQGNPGEPQTAPSYQGQGVVSWPQAGR